MQGQQCNFCRWYTGLGTCGAFPDGIPEDVVHGAVTHDEDLPGQESPGVHFEVADGLEDRWAAWRELVKGAGE
jgi:hypothetical protein